MQSMIGEPRPSASYQQRPDHPLVLEARDRPCRLWTLWGVGAAREGERADQRDRDPQSTHIIPPPVAMPAPGKRGWEMESKVSALILTHRHRLRSGRKKKRLADAGTHLPDGTAAWLLVQSSTGCVSDLWVIKTGTPLKNVRLLDH